MAIMMNPNRYHTANTIRWCFVLLRCSKFVWQFIMFFYLNKEISQFIVPGFMLRTQSNRQRIIRVATQGRLMISTVLWFEFFDWTY